MIDDLRELSVGDRVTVTGDDDVERSIRVTATDDQPPERGNDGRFHVRGECDQGEPWSIVILYRYRWVDEFVATGQIVRRGSECSFTDATAWADVRGEIHV